MTNPSISVIVPVYNASKYLPETLASLSGQTFRNFEIVCVNDGSTDDSLEILENYRSKDDRLRIVTQPNSGVSAARNSGVASARGKYIFFLDSDDLLLPRILEELFHKAEEYDAEVACADYQKFNRDGLRPEAVYPGFSRSGDLDGAFTWKELPEELINRDALLGPVWGKLISREFYVGNDIRFPVGIRFAEDCVVCFKLMTLSKSIVCIPTIGIHYRSFNDGITSLNGSILFDMIKSFKLIEFDVGKINDDKINRFWESRKYDTYKSTALRINRRDYGIFLEEIRGMLPEALFNNIKKHSTLRRYALRKFNQFLKTVVHVKFKRDRKILRIFGIYLVKKSTGTSAS